MVMQRDQPFTSITRIVVICDPVWHLDAHWTKVPEPHRLLGGGFKPVDVDDSSTPSANQPFK